MTRPGPRCLVCGMASCSWANGKRCEGRLHPVRVLWRDWHRVTQYATHVVALLVLMFLFGVAFAGVLVPH